MAAGERSTVIIGCEADFRSRKSISHDEVSKLIRRLKEHVNLSYDGEPTIAKQIGVNEGALNGWLAGKVKPAFQSLLKLRDFLERQVEARAVLRLSAMCRYGVITRMGEEGMGGEVA
jgi:transcriptional regulator with XRE-family HTH domain